MKIHVLLCALTVTLMAQPAETQLQVQNILRRNCYGCHGPAMQQSGLRLDDPAAALKGGNSGAAIIPLKSELSPLLHRIRADKGVPAMPPGPRRLKPEEIAAIAKWIDQGAALPKPASPSVISASPAEAAASRHWAFRSVGNPQPPAIAETHEIDRFIRARLAKENIKPSPEASRRVLLRRLSFDLTGLPPTATEIAQFLDDKRPGAYERQIDRLLASPHFGEKWARHWLDQARYADSDGYEKDWIRPWAWRWRNWVIDAINRDMPFDQFTIEQMAGDLLPNATIEQKVATGFHRNTLTNREGGIDDKQFQFENTLDRASTVGTVWLGLTVACSQCHDHKFDPIPQKDLYSLYAFFDNVEEENLDAPMPGEVGPWLRTQAEYQAKRAALIEEYKVAPVQAAWEKDILYTIAHPGERTDWDLAWDCVNKLTEGGNGAKIVQIPPDKRTPRESAILTDHFIGNYHFAVGRKKWKDLKLDELQKKLAELKSQYPQLTQAMTIQETGKAEPTHLRIRGDYKAFGIEVQPATLSALPPLGLANGARATRLDLGRWLVRRDNPLTARVTVNRVWQELFGAALVRTPDDFGLRSEPPVHPELLDWLAASFMDNGWSRKELIRKIVLSATYRQSSTARPDLQERDPSNTLLARQNRVRLTGEAIRDAALQASGLLTTQIGGPSVNPPMPAGVVELSYGYRNWGLNWKSSNGADRYRRGLYIQFLRTVPYPMLVNFDAPKASVAACRRDRSNTALQALNLLNDPVFLETAQALALRTLTNGAARDFASRLDSAYLETIGRPPSATEKQRLQAYFEKQDKLLESDPKAVAQLAPIAPGGATQRETAAWTALASVLLNLEEFITRE